jgi:branched-chain amino acid aminotransferase, group I
MYYNDNTILYFNGRMVKAVDAGTDLYGQTLHYGYGVFEGIRSYQTNTGIKIFKAKEHYDRLIRSCELLNIPFSYSVEELTNLTYELLALNNFTEAYIRPLVICGHGMSLQKPVDSTLIIEAWNWDSYLGEKLLRLKISPFCRPHPKSTKVDAKACGHYVNSILAGTDAKDSGFDEALLLDHQGYLAEGPGANLFFEKNGKLFTPQPGNILTGITRATIFEIGNQLGIDVEEGQYTPEELLNADSAFYCGTGAEVVGIKSVNEKIFPKRWNDSIGKIIQQAYKLVVREEEFKNILRVA